LIAGEEATPLRCFAKNSTQRGFHGVGKDGGVIARKKGGGVWRAAQEERLCLVPFTGKDDENVRKGGEEEITEARVFGE